jgi:hypothetical protein
MIIITVLKGSKHQTSKHQNKAGGTKFLPNNDVNGCEVEKK